jgi:segregation and condensation protein B
MEGLIDTRNEYIEHIQDILSVAISKRIYAIYTEMMEEKKGLKGFQNELYSIRKWNNNIVSDEYKKIVKYTKCKYLSNLIKIIIITTIKIKIYEYREHFDNIKIKIPNPEDFVHKCYINAASFSWKNAYLYNRNNIKDAEYQNNLNLIEENIRAIIKKTFRDFVPFDEIFKQIEDNLTGTVKQFKDTGGEEGDEGNASDNASDDASDDASNDASDDESNEDIEPTKASKATKKTKKTDKKPVKPEEEASEDEEDEEDDEEDDEDDEEDEDENENENENEDEDEEEDDEDEDDEKDEEESEADDDEESEEESEADASDDNKNEIEEKKIPITVLKEQVEPDYNKINNIVDIPDIPLTKYNDETLNQQQQEISFKAFFSSNQENKQDSERIESNTRDTREAPKEPFETDNIRKEWNSIKDDYHSLSQGNAKYADTKYENDNDDAISVMSVASVASARSERSVASNITDISLIKKIHIKEASNKSKKPSFF